MNILERIDLIKTKTIMILALLFLAVPGFLKFGTQKIFYHMLTAVLIAGFLDFLFVYIKKKNLAFPDSGIVTGLVVALILRPGLNMWIVSATAVLAIVSKYILRYHRGHIFNPANFGLLMSLLLFNVELSWWGDSSKWLVIIVGTLIAIKYKKLPLVFSFLITGIVVMGFYSLKRDGDMLSSLLMLNYFFVFIMVTDPKTSPINSWGRILYGIITALFTTGFMVFDWPRGNYWVFGLACSNITVPFINWLTLRKSANPRVEDTKANLKICAENCGKCPTFPGGAAGLLYCAGGKTLPSDTKKKGCRCPVCDVQKKYGSTGTYYCMYGKSK